MKVLIIGGYQMLVTDGSAYWALAATLRADGHEVRARECAEDWLCAGPRAKVAADDLLWADAVVCYSYGMASWKHIGHRLQKAWPAGKRYKIACVVAGVPDFAYAQFYGNLWHLWDWVDKGRCWQVDAIPASAALGNAGYRWVGAGEPIPADVRWVNINCNQLVAGLNPVGRHTHIQTNPTVLAQIRAEINKAA